MSPRSVATAPARRLVRPRIEEFSIQELTADTCQSRLAELEIALKDAFSQADFMSDFGSESPWTHTAEGIVGTDSDAYRHVIAQTTEGGVWGAAFRVPVRLTASREADPGWFFIARDVPPRQRGNVADAIVTTAHRLMREAGFIRVVTQMGTRSGARFLRHHHGYVHVPLPDRENRWMHTLT